MWACRSIPPLLPPLDSSSITCSKPNRIFLVSAKYQPRRSRRQNTNFNYNLDDDDDDNHNNNVEVTPEESVEDIDFISGDSGEQQQQVPSGSDILMALRRATVRKHNSKKKKKQQLVPPGPDSKDVLSNAPPVKPLRIRSDWGSRLDELELRLRDILHV